MGVLSILAGLQELALRTLQELAKTTTACSNAMNALDAAKADRLELHAVTIPAAGWKKDDRGCYIDLDMPGLTADDSIAVLIEPDSADAAKAAVLDSTTQSSTDTLRLRAWKIPTADLHAHYYTIREDILMALGTVAMGVGNYVLPPATADTLGGVMIGDGLAVDGNGKASFEPNTLNDVQTTALSTHLAGEGIKVDGSGKLSVGSSGSLTAYPVGSIYQSINLVSPAKLFGGDWMQVAADRVLMGASNSHFGGTTAEAALPNITGEIASSYAKNYYNNGWHPSGAFKLNEKNIVTNDTAESGSQAVGSFYETIFDASLSNAIYGASDTVQPPAYYVYNWLRLGSVVHVITDPENDIHLIKGADKVTGIADTNGVFDAELPSPGEWTITVARNGESKTKTFVINEYTQCNVRITTADVFGVVWDYSNSSTALTRLNRQSDPSGFVTVDVLTEPVAAVGTDFGSSPFDSHAPWSGMEEYNIVNNAVGPKYGETGFSRTNNDTMVYIPEFYYNVKDDSANSKRYFYISDRKIDGFEKHPGSGRYVGRYNTITGNYSESGAAPYVNMTINTARTGATGKGSKWSLYDYASWCAIQLLYLVEYADWNSQTKIGRGYVDGSSALTSGATDTMAYHTGRVAGTDGKTAVQYRHIENAWGNVAEFVDGLNAKGSSVYICTDPSRYASNTADRYIEFTGMPTASAYISGLKYYDDYPWLMLPQTGKGSSSTYIPDLYGYWTSDWAYMKIGGHYSSGSNAGLFNFDRGGSTSEKLSNMGARLQFNP